MKQYLISLLFFLFCIFYAFEVSAFQIQDSFSSRKWYSWGEGSVEYDFSKGQADLGSLHFQVLPREKATAYRKFTKLKSGHYTFSFWIKADRLQFGPWNRSFWVWSNGGNGELTCAENFTGTFDWTKLTCTAFVKKTQLEIWFSLQSTGNVWIDDFTLFSSKGELVQTRMPKQIKPVARVYRVSKRCFKPSNTNSRFLLKIKQGDSDPFRKIKMIDGKLMGEIKNRKFYNFDVDKLLNVPWDNYDYVEFNLYLPGDKQSNVAFTIEDSESDSYWTKLNFKSVVTPGWNVLKFPLHRKVGERGSYKVNRSIDYLQLEKIWISLDPDGEKSVKRAYVSDFKISKREKIQTFKQFFLIDFVRDSHRAFPCFMPVTAFDKYVEGDQFGFIRPVKKAHDSIYADTLNRDSIWVNNNEFILKVPNGKYRLYLNWNMLGYWDVPFWSKRILTLQGKPITAELRSSKVDYLKDYLRFENVEPSIYDNPWDLYLEELFHPLTYDVTVTDGILRLGFDGDDSGIALNWLVLFPLKQREKGERMMSKLASLLKKDYQGVTRKIENTKKMRLTPYGIWPQNIFDRSLAKYDLPLNKKQFYRFSALNMSHFFNFIINNKKGEKVDLVVTSSDSCISTSIYQGVYQFISVDRNHETYSLKTQFLRPVNESIQTEPAINKQVVVKVNISDQCTKGEKKVLFTYKYGRKIKKFMAKIDVIAKKLEPLKIPVGFLGLSPIDYSYYRKSDEVKMDQQYWRLKALKMLEERGFTLLSDFPKETIQREKLLSIAQQTGFKGVLTYGNNEWIHELISQHRELNTVFKVKPLPLFSFSDEAGGYQDRLEQDANYAKKIKLKYPFIPIGGFSMMDKYHRKLNKLFDVGLYSNYKKPELKHIKKWGLYNLASKPLDNPRYIFGIGLYYFEKMGLSILAEWNAGAVHNYPYFDLDGRENDAVMFYPTTSGDLLPSIKLEQAYQGIVDYKLMKLLNPMVAKKITHKMKPAFDNKTGFLINPSRSSSLINKVRKELLKKIRF